MGIEKRSVQNQVMHLIAVFITHSPAPAFRYPDLRFFNDWNFLKITVILVTAWILRFSLRVSGYN